MNKDMHACCGGGFAGKGLFLIIIAAILFFNDMYGWFSFTQILALIIALVGLKCLLMSQKAKN